MQNGRDVKEEEAHASLGWIYQDLVQEVQLGSGVRLPKKSQDIKDVRYARAKWNSLVSECSKCGYAWSCSLNLDVKCKKQEGRQWNRMDDSLLFLKWWRKTKVDREKESQVS